jgi:hypothetical protein
MARDAYHDAVRHALEKEGWQITHDPFPIPLPGVTLQVDLGAERLVAAIRDNERIAVEIKVFGGASFVQAFHLALGQFLNYRVNLQLQEPERHLWLAVTSDTFDSFFHTELVTRSVTHYQVPILVFNPLTEVIELWQAT